MSKVSGRVRAAVVAGTLAASTAAVVGTAQPASATDNDCTNVGGYFWSTDQDMADARTDSCRGTWVVDPGRHNHLDRDELVRHAGLYASQGIPEQFLWYAPEGTTTIPAGSSLKWSACHYPSTRDGNACRPDQVNTSPQHTLSFDFGGRTVDLRTLSWDGHFVALVCGNFDIHAGATIDGPVPVIHGFKYDDANRDKVQDNGEAGIQGITFQLFRTSSLYQDQPTGYVTSATTDAAGNFSFPLVDRGPGTYRVVEVPSPDWVNTNPDQPWDDVTVSPGRGPEDIYIKPFSNRSENPPHADAGPEQAVDQTSDAGASVVLDGSRSYDPDGDALTYTWTVDGQTQTGTDPHPTFVLPVGTWPVHLTVSDGVKTDEDTTTVTVYPPITLTGHDTSSLEGLPFGATVGTFTDPDPKGTADEYRGTVNWGDGSSSPADSITKGADGTFTVRASHTYVEEGHDAASVTVTDADNAYNTASSPFTATVTDAPLHATGASILSTNPVNQVVATFTDDNPGAPKADFTASIDWGDGTPATTGVISGPVGGTFSVSGTHTYDTLGPKTAHIHIVDEGGSTADATTGLIIYQASGFVIGDLDSAVGSHVTYWGAQWWKDNQLSGGTAPAAFKGYANNPAASTSLPAWTTDPGNSSQPPAAVPTYMSIIVSSSVGQRGSTISGDAPHIVIVRTDPGYAAAPGHTGTGTVVATLR